MTYCANDVLATHAVFAKLWPEFLERWDQQNHALSLVPYVDFLLERWDQQNHALSLVPYLDFLLELQHHCTYQQKNWNIAELSKGTAECLEDKSGRAMRVFLLSLRWKPPVYVITDGNSHLPLRWKTQFMLSLWWKLTLTTQVENPVYVITLMETHTYHSGGKPSLCYHSDGNSHLPLRWKPQFMLSLWWKLTLTTQVETPVYVITLMETHTYHSGGKPSLCYHSDGNSHLPLRWKTQFMLSLMETHTYHSGGKPSVCYHLDANPSSCQEISIHCKVFKFARKLPHHCKDIILGIAFWVCFCFTNSLLLFLNWRCISFSVYIILILCSDKLCFALI